MLADQYFKTKQELTDFAVQFRELDQNNWYVRTSFVCGHECEHRKKGILLIHNERCIQRLMICKRCTNRVAKLEPAVSVTQEGGNDGSH